MVTSRTTNRLPYNLTPIESLLFRDLNEKKIYWETRAGIGWRIIPVNLLMGIGTMISFGLLNLITWAKLNEAMNEIAPYMIGGFAILANWICIMSSFAVTEKRIVIRIPTIIGMNDFVSLDDILGYKVGKLGCSIKLETRGGYLGSRKIWGPYHKIQQLTKILDAILASG